MFANLSIKSKGIMALVGGFLMHLILGTFYLWGNINVYVSSYLYHKGDETMDNAKVNFVFPFMMLAIGNINFRPNLNKDKYLKGVCNPLGVPLSNFLGYKLHLILCCCLVFVGVFLASFFTNFYLFVLSYGVLFGCSSGLL
jgi:OFA family oxalate/formate antiporter-like MFS transporter